MSVIGWRKLGLGLFVIAAAYAYIYIYTTGEPAVAPEIPGNVRDIIMGVFWAFVGGNVAGKFAKAKGGDEPS